MSQSRLQKTINANYSDLNAYPLADLQYDGVTASMPVGEGVAFGDLLYMKSDGKLWKADANSDTTAPAMVIATATALADTITTVLLVGFIRNNSWSLTVGGKVYASGTAGGVTQTAPNSTNDIVQIIGIAFDAHRFYFSPDFTTVKIT